jgi:hypothetical protein
MTVAGDTLYAPHHRQCPRQDRRSHPERESARLQFPGMPEVQLARRLHCGPRWAERASAAGVLMLRFYKLGNLF